MSQEDSFFESFIFRVRQAAKHRMMGLAEGGADNYSEYKYVCGVIAGLDQAERIFEELVQKHMGEK